MAKSGRPKAYSTARRLAAFPVDDSCFVQTILHQIGIIKLHASDNDRDRFLQSFVDLREKTNAASHALEPFREKLVQLRALGAPMPTLGTTSAASAHNIALSVSLNFRCHVAGGVMTQSSYPDWCFDPDHFNTAVRDQWEQVRALVLSFSLENTQAPHDEFAFAQLVEHERSIQAIVLEIEKERLALAPSNDGADDGESAATGMKPKKPTQTLVEFLNSGGSHQTAVERGLAPSVSASRAAKSRYGNKRGGC